MSRRPLNVLQVVHALGMGGAETWLLELLRHWAVTGECRVDFLITGGKPDLFDEQARELGARLYYLPYGRSALPCFVARFRQLLSRGRYDVIHDHADYASGWRLLFGAGALPPVRIAHVHNPWLHIDANYAVSPARRLATDMGRRLVRNLATDVCGTSAEVLRQYGFEPDRSARPRISVAHCGIDVDKFNAPRDVGRASVLEEFAWPDDAKVVLFAGRLDRSLTFDHPQNHKNSWFALNVVRAAVAADPSVRLLMAGAGAAPRRQLEERIAEWGLTDSLRLIGVRQDLPRLMRAADVVFFPSRQEGLGMVAVEAQAAGRPVLTSTAVPRECVVVPELVDALPLTRPVEEWAARLLARIAAPVPSLVTCRSLVGNSAFSIQNSARRLMTIYSSAA